MSSKTVSKCQPSNLENSFKKENITIHNQPLNRQGQLVFASSKGNIICHSRRYVMARFLRISSISTSKPVRSESRIALLLDLARYLLSPLSHTPLGYCVSYLANLSSVFTPPPIKWLPSWDLVHSLPRPPFSPCVGVDAEAYQYLHTRLSLITGRGGNIS